MACAPTCTLAPLFSEQCFRFPLIINAPMAHFAGGDLAAAVTLAGGLGMIGCINDAAWLSSQLDQCAILLRNASPEFEKLPTVPIGIGFLPFAAQLTKFVPLVKKYRPKVVWLFAAESVEVYTRWATEMRRACPGSQIWIQTGSMHEALEIAAQAKPDVLVLQGSDAGGHGHERSASLISLLPEAVDIFKRGKIEIPIVASGGISDARGAAAAFTLGAQGVVMGTRFLGSKEVLLHPTYQAAVIEARFGGSNTVRSKFFDDLTVPNPWPKGYDGRSLAVKSYQEWLIDRNMERARRLYAEAKTHESGGFARGCKGVAPIWAGASLGLVNKLSFAGEIIHETRRGARAVL
ncbi:NPD-domain-containing protein, partial [Amniculicola lignicola CBS 123094]